MPSSANALINKNMLVWARESAGLNVEEAAQKLGVSEEKLSIWESGEAFPTIKQLKKIANGYKQSFAAFYLAKVPPVFKPPMKDFRRLPGDAMGAISTELRYDTRRALERRDIFLELLEERGETPVDFSLKSTMRRSPESLAKELREFLRVTIRRQLSWRDDRLAFNWWQEMIERQGVLVFQATRVPLDEMRGYSIAKFPLPIVVVNWKDSYTGRIFTMLHELVHLIIRSSGVCDLDFLADRPPEQQRTEVFCNRVAGNALVPADHLLSHSAVTHDHGPAWTIDELAGMARYYSVSRDVILRRLLTCGRTTNFHYMRTRAALAKEYEELKKKNGEKSGYVPPYRNAISAAGKPMVRLVLESLDAERITANDVSDYLDVKLRHLQRIGEAMEME